MEGEGVSILTKDGGSTLVRRGGVVSRSSSSPGEHVLEIPNLVQTTEFLVIPLLVFFLSLSDPVRGD